MGVVGPQILALETAPTKNNRRCAGFNVKPSVRIRFGLGEAEFGMVDPDLRKRLAASIRYYPG